MDRIISLDLHDYDDLPAHTRLCTFWETEQSTTCDTHHFDDAFEKEAWISNVLLEWGVCGQVLIRNGQPVGTCLYAPPKYSPRDKLMRSGPVSADAILLSHVYIDDDNRSIMAYVTLINAALHDLRSRGVRAVEAYGRQGDVGTYPKGADPTSGEFHKCIPTQDILLACGFKEIISDPTVSRWRIDIDSRNLWAHSVKAALDKRYTNQKIDLLTYQRKTGKVRCRSQHSKNTRTRTKRDHSAQPPKAPQK